MRTVYLVFLLLFVSAVAIFAFQNNYSVTLKFLNRSIDLPFPAVIGAVYVLGMFTGWSVVGLLRKWGQRVTERHEQRR